MKKTRAIGKRIVAVEQDTITNTRTGTLIQSVTAIVLSDGTRLLPHVSQLENDLVVDFIIIEPKRIT